MLSRRDFLQTTAGFVAADVVGAAAARTSSGELGPVATLPANLTRTWIGAAFWANRLQDWQLANGRIECVTGDKTLEVRTVAILTREIVRGSTPAHLLVRAGLIEDAGGGGFCGFLIGAGGGAIDYRAAALVQRSSGVGGGILCTFETDGTCRFREHTDEEHPIAFAELPAQRTEVGPAFRPGPAAAEAITLRLDITPQSNGAFTLHLRATDASGNLRAETTRRDVADTEIAGGIALVSSGARYWFDDLRSGGTKIAVREERAFGPILGTLHSLNGRVLKLSAQLAPVGDAESREVCFDYRAPGGAWQAGPAARLENGWSALFRIDNWDATRDWEYRVGYPAGDSAPATYTGTIRKEPADRPLTIGLLSCTIATARPLDSLASPGPELPQAELLGRYTEKNIYFPHRTLATHVASHKPDVLLFAGDQFYEGNPTRRDSSPRPSLDDLYKWFLWVWSFRDLTRDTPAIVLVDDHDMYQGNIWGNGGRAAPQGDQNRGGYRCAADWVNMVQRTQCGHDPDPFDPAPVEQDITVYYGAFRYGGVSFAVLEDRKFKTAPLQGEDLDVHEAAS